MVFLAEGPPSAALLFSGQFLSWKTNRSSIKNFSQNFVSKILQFGSKSQKSTFVSLWPLRKLSTSTMRFGKKFKEVHLLYVKSPKSRLCILHPLSYLRQVAPSQRRYSLSEVLHNIRDLTSSHNFFVTLLARSSPVCSMMHGEESTIKSRNWITFFAFPTTLLSSSVIRRLCWVSSSASVSWIPEESQIFAVRIQKDQQSRWRGR